MLPAVSHQQKCLINGIYGGFCHKDKLFWSSDIVWEQNTFLESVAPPCEKVILHLKGDILRSHRVKQCGLN